MKSLLIILTGSLGDICRGFCLLRPIKKRFPECKISWLTDQRWTKLVEAHPLIDEVLVFDRRERAQGILKCVRMLRRLSFECVLDLQRILKSGIFSWTTGAGRRIGFHRRDSKEFNWLFQTESIQQVGDGVSKVIHYTQFLSVLGINDHHEVDFGLPKGCFKEFIPEGFPDGFEDPPYSSLSIGIVMGSSWRSKDWPLQGVQRLVAGLLSTYPDTTIHLVGDASRQSMAAAIEESFASGIGVEDTTSQRSKGALSVISSSNASAKAESKVRIYNWVGKTDLTQLAAIIERCVMVIGPDSGPGHLAAALGIPYMGLFGPTDPERVAAWGSKHLAIKSEIGCSPCGKRECPGLDTLCMRTISPERVIKGVKEALGSSS